MPEKPDNDDSKTPGVSRLKKLQADGVEPEMPPAEAPHLVSYLWEVGPVLTGGTGEAPLTFQEVQYWQDQTGIKLLPWQARLLIRLSKEYLAESTAATKPDCPAPYKPEAFQPSSAEIAARMKASMRKMAAM